MAPGAVRISSRAVRVFPALSHVRPSCGTFFLILFHIKRMGPLLKQMPGVFPILFAQ